MADLGSPARYLATTGSTMLDARQGAAEGAPHGALVVAAHQTDGRGRHGRAWAAAPGDSLLFTLVLRPTTETARLGLVPLAAGLAVAESLDALGIVASVKWPNDVRVGGRKLAGVLTQAVHGERPMVLLGVGLNVRQKLFPKELSATSVRLESGLNADPAHLLPPLLAALTVRLGEVETAPDALLAGVHNRMESVGETVTVRDPGTRAAIASGAVVGLAPDGALRLATADGERTVYAGEVTLSR